MRVLHVSPYFAPAFVYGGPPRSILGLCQALRRSGIDVEVFSTAANGLEDLPASASESLRYDGVPVRYFPRAFPRRMFGSRGLGAGLRDKAGRYDLVHIHGLWNLPGWTAARYARAVRIPYVISPRGMLDAGSLVHHAWLKRVMYSIRERRHVEGAAMLHATSEAEATTLARRAPGVPVVMLPNGVEAPADVGLGRGRFRRRLRLPADAPLIVFLGRLHPIKRLDLLATAFAGVRARHRTARLVIAGPDEAGYRARMEPLFAPVGEAVHWIGEVGEADKWMLLTDADALVLCSDSESFGLSVLEAMAAAVPVVATRTCPWEEVETAGCGFLVPHDAQAIAGALGRLLDEPAQARAMGDKGRALARAKYSWDSIAGGMAERYRDVVARRTGVSVS
jgi:glycosyltransferase involved in cell wall biosynthesis